MSNKQRKGLRPPRAAAKLDMGLSTLWARARTEPDFPEPIKIGKNTAICLETELDEFIERQIAESRGITRVSGSRKTGCQV